MCKNFRWLYYSFISKVKSSFRTGSGWSNCFKFLFWFRSVILLSKMKLLFSACEKLPNSSCHFWKHKSVFLQILYHSSVPPNFNCKKVSQVLIFASLPSRNIPQIFNFAKMAKKRQICEKMYLRKLILLRYNINLLKLIVAKSSILDVEIVSQIWFGRIYTLSKKVLQLWMKIKLSSNYYDIIQNV